MKEWTCTICNSIFPHPEEDGLHKSICPECGRPAVNIYNEIMNSDISNLILGCLLLLKKEGYNINDLKDISSAVEFIFVDIFKDLSNNHQFLLKKIEKEIATALSEKINRLIEIIDLIYNKDEIPQYFDKLLFRETKRGEMPIQPNNVTKFIASLVKLPDNSLIYNPFSGFASYGVDLGQKYKYFGQELNGGTWELGIIRLLLNGISPENYICEDSIINWNNWDKKFDLIISTPPYGMKESRHKFHLNYNNPSFNNNPEFDRAGVAIPAKKIKDESTDENDINYASSLEEYFILRCISDLNTNGLAVALLPIGILNRVIFQNLRKTIIDKDLLEMVISLPSNQLYPYTLVPSCIIILNKNKTESAFVKFFDFGPKSSNRIEHQDDLIVFFESNINKENQFFKTVAISDIKNKRYRLNVHEYVFEEKSIPKGFTPIKLGEILSPMPRKTVKVEYGRLIRVDTLANNCFNYYKNPEDFGFDNLPPKAIKINSEVLVTDGTSIDVKATYCRASEENPVYCSLRYNCFKLKENFINHLNLDYLIYELSSDRLKEQMMAFFGGTALTRLQPRELLELNILLPKTLEEQAAIVLGAKRTYQQDLLKREGLEGIIEEMKKNYKDELSLKRHNLIKYIFGASASTTLLEKFIEKKDYKDDKVSPEKSIIDQIKTIKSILNDLSTSIKDLTIDINTGELEKVDIDEFLSNFSFGDYPVNYIVDEESFNIEDDDELIREIESSSEEESQSKVNAIVKISKNEFKKVMVNIFDNAIIHGLTERNKNNFNYRIYLRYLASDDIFIIEIWNNGTSFAPGVTTESYISRGISVGKNHGEGLGGYYISETIKYFKGKLEIQKDLDDEYRVGVIIKLPKFHNYEQV